MVTKTLKETVVDERFDAFVILKEFSKRVTQQGKPYFAVTVADATGEISGMKWDVTPAEENGLQVGAVVALTAIKQLYRDKPQLKIFGLRPTVPGEPTDPADFIVAAPMTETAMRNEVQSVVAQITQPVWQQIVQQLLRKYDAEFYRAPAAKSNHHAFKGGLAFHTLSITRLAQSVAQQYPHLNAALIYAGALFHDLGKVLELSGPVATQYTVAGNLLGHITLIDEQIVLVAHELNLDLNSEELVLLRHTVLAHHGQLEWGSPVRPLVMEAQVLHLLDELDANLNSFSKALDETEPGDFSGRIFALDGRSIYHPKFK